ncbi:MAG TPA: hypothetical protein VMU14_19870 [Acidimicrobiales bacterium]|nr:hypothetical protein [Acidimicrobiales bacterium]
MLSAEAAWAGGAEGLASSPPRWALPAIAAVAAAVRTPYAIEGPRFLLDDYYTLWYRTSRGVLGTPGPGQLAARPGAWAAYLLEFGIIGRHPLIGYLVLAGLGVLTAVLLCRCLARLIPWQAAFAVSALWAVTANHSSLDHWLSTVNIALGLLLLIAGIDVLVTSRDTPHAIVPATVLLVASALCYEAALPVAAVAVVVVPRLRGHRPSLRTVALAEAALVTTGIWMATHSRHDLGGGAFSYRDLPTSLFGSGVIPAGWAAHGLVIIATVVVAVSIDTVVRRRSMALGPWMVICGVGVIILGTLAFARDPISPLDLGDRVNEVAAIGAELVCVGGALQAARWRWAAPVALMALFAIGVAGHVERDLDYRDAGRDTAQIFAAVLKAHPSPPGRVIVVGPRYISHHGITGMLGPEDQAFDAMTGVDGWEVWVAMSPSDLSAALPSDRVLIHA